LPMPGIINAERYTLIPDSLVMRHTACICEWACVSVAITWRWTSMTLTEGRWRGLGRVAVLALLMLAACSDKYGGTVKSGNAADWMFRACGIKFSQPPVVVKNASLELRRPSGSMSGTVTVPDADMAAAIAALGLNRALHRRGMSETRYSYESYADVVPERECELDASLHILYFRYKE
jgi:hypothetical protein